MKKITVKYVTEKTFEKSMEAIAKSFARVEESLEKHERVLDMILKELKNLYKSQEPFIKSVIKNHKILSGKSVMELIE